MLKAVAADSRGQGGQLPTLGKKKVGKTMFLPTYLREEALWHRIPHESDSVQQVIFSSGVPIGSGAPDYHRCCEQGVGIATIGSIMSVYDIRPCSGPTMKVRSCTPADRKRHLRDTGGPHADKEALWQI